MVVAVSGGVAGIDWPTQYDDVRRLVCSCPAFVREVGDGHDADDVLQDVLVGIMARERGTSAFRRRLDDPGYGLGSYVWMVTRCVVANRREARGCRIEEDTSGLRAGGRCGDGPVDAALWAACMVADADAIPADVLAGAPPAPEPVTQTRVDRRAARHGARRKQRGGA